MSCTARRWSRTASLFAALRSPPTTTITTTTQHVLRPTPPSSSLSSSSPLLRPLRRSFATTPSQHFPPVAKTVQQVKARNRSGPFSARAAIVFLIAGAGLIVYFRMEKQRMDRKRIAEASKGVGKPKIGGPFDLIDEKGESFSDRDLKGGFSIVSLFLSACFPLLLVQMDSSGGGKKKRQGDCGQVRR